MSSVLERFLRRHTPGARESAEWAGGTMPLRVMHYLCDELPPQQYISSVRSIVRRGNDVLLCRNADGMHIVPGGRREAGETLEQTLAREVLEETGWRIARPRLLGFMHFQHLAPKPAGYRHPHPHFIMIVYLSEAMAFVPGAKVEDDYEIEAVLQPIPELNQVELGAGCRFFLQAVMDTLTPPGSGAR